MVFRTDLQHLCPTDLSQATIVCDPHVVQNDLSRALGVSNWAVRQMLDDVPAQGNVQDLHASADSQERHSALGDCHGKLELVDVALGVYFRQLPMGLLAEVLGIDVTPTGENETIEPIEIRTTVSVTGRDHKQAAAGTSNGIDVGYRQCVPIGLFGLPVAHGTYDRQRLRGAHDLHYNIRDVVNVSERV
jgi:hypothetical protein